MITAGQGNQFCEYKYVAPSYTGTIVSIKTVEMARKVEKEILKELLELPVRQKTVIYLHYVEGYQIKEIADILGITESAVKLRLLRGRKQMRDAVSMEGGI